MIANILSPMWKDCCVQFLIIVISIFSLVVGRNIKYVAGVSAKLFQQYITLSLFYIVKAVSLHENYPAHAMCSFRIRPSLHGVIKI